jgi:hypothetical protein
MSWSLFIMLALILHALWRKADPKGTAEWDETLSDIVGYGLAMVIVLIVVGGPLLWIVMEAAAHRAH